MSPRRLGSVLRPLAALAAVAGVAVAGACGNGPEAGATAAPLARLQDGGVPAAPGAILLVTIDTLRWDAVGSSGSGRVATPALDGMAARGARFEYAVAHAVLTLPSHSSILTGLDPSRHGVQDNSGFRLSDQIETLGERLGGAGYATGAFVAAFPLDSQFGLAQGFDVYDDSYDTGAHSEFQMVERPARDVVLPARRWIRSQRGPWFAWVHVYDPHAPYVPPEPFASRYPDDPYAAEVASTDAELAPLLEEALQAGALVIVTSDHGEGQGDHGELRHGVFAYESTLRIPLLVAWPGVLPAGRVVPGRVRHVDLVPTVCDAVGLECPDLDGVSLLPALGGGTTPVGPSYFEAMSPMLTRGWAPLRGLYVEDWKFIDLPIPELYRMPSDPGETRNLVGQERRQVESMRAALAEHLAAAGDMQASIGAESEETLRRLSALGYLGGASPAPTRTDWGPADDPKNLIELDSLMQEAVQLAAEGQIDRAAGLFRRILEARPDFIRVHALLAGLEARRGNLEGAIAQLDRALRAGIQAPYLLTRLGMYLRDVGRLDEAAQVLQESLRGEPENLLTINLLATVEGASGRFDEALRLIDLGLELDASYALLYANRGTVYLSQDRLDEAAEQFETALRHDARVAEAHNGLGVLAAMAGNQDEALQRWRTAVSIDPTQFDAMYNLGNTLLRLERFGEAGPVLETFVRTAPPSRYARNIQQFNQVLQDLRRSRQQ